MNDCSLYNYAPASLSMDSCEAKRTPGFTLAPKIPVILATWSSVQALQPRVFVATRNKQELEELCLKYFVNEVIRIITHHLGCTHIRHQ